MKASLFSLGVSLICWIAFVSMFFIPGVMGEMSPLGPLFLAFFWGGVIFGIIGLIQLIVVAVKTLKTN